MQPPFLWCLFKIPHVKSKWGIPDLPWIFPRLHKSSQRPPPHTHTCAFLSLCLCSCSSTFPDICTANFSSSKCHASLKAGLHLILTSRHDSPFLWTSFIKWKLFLCLISVTQLNLPNVALHALFILLALCSSCCYTKHHGLLQFIINGFVLWFSPLCFPKLNFELLEGRS